MIQGTAFISPKTVAFFEAFIEQGYYSMLLEGIVNTLKLTLIASIIGLIIGLVVAFIQIIENPKNLFLSIVMRVLKLLTKIYLSIIRGTPVIVQLTIMWFVIVPVIESAVVSIIGPGFSISKELAGGIAFGINSGAYMAELVRAGIQGIDKGQMEAGRSLGLSYAQTMWLIIIPQAFKQMLPALVNEFIVLIKETAIVSYIGGMDIMKAANIMMTNTFNAMWPLCIAAFCYWLLTWIFTQVMKAVERKITTN